MSRRTRKKAYARETVKLAVDPGGFYPGGESPTAATPPPREIYTLLGREVGASGTNQYRGWVWNNEDYNPDLQGQAGILVWEKMRSSDAQVAGIIAHITQPFQSATYKIFPGTAPDPSGKGRLEPTKKAIQQAAFMEDMLFHYPILDGKSEGWSSFVRHMLLAPVFGVMAFEKVMGIDRKGRQVYAKLAPRLPKSIWNFVLKLDGSNALDYMVQYAATARGYERIAIPAQDLLLFTPFREGDNYFSRSILRPCYMNWFHKRELIRLDGMRHERHGVGVPMIKLNDGAGEAENKAAENVLKELRAHQRQFVKIPFDFEFEIMYPTGTPTPIIESLRYHDEQMARALLLEVMNMGQGSSGSRSLGQVKNDFFMLALQGMGNYFIDKINREVIQPAIELNDGPTEYPPYLQIEDLDSMSPFYRAEFMKTMVESGVIKADDDLEEFARKQASLPPADTKTAREFVNPPITSGPDGKANMQTQKKPPGMASENPKLLAEPTQATRPAFRRSPLGHELHVDWFAMRDYLDTEPKRVYDEVVKPIRDQQLKKIAAQVASASPAALAKRDVPRPLKGRIAADLFKALKDSYFKGRESVIADRERQKRGIKLAAEPDDKYKRVLALAQALGISEEEAQQLIEEGVDAESSDTDKVRGFSDFFSEHVTEAAIIAAIAMALQVRAAIPSVTREDLERRILGTLESTLSEGRITADLGGDVIQAFTLGRNDQILSMEGLVEHYYYSAIMDENTCETCAEKDGEEFDPEDDTYAVPSPDCDWPPNCRCEWAVEFSTSGDSA